jgi:hypothetical protein
MTAYTPPGWPGSVRPPGAAGWEATATAFLFDCAPPDFRGYRVLHRHPVVLARFAAQFVAGQRRTAEEGLAEVRTSLSCRVPPEVVQAAAEAWLEQGAQLARTQRAVGLVEAALRGEHFTPKL